MDSETEKLRRYFLGYLDESESEDVDMLILSDSELEYTLLGVENDLIEDYVDGSLDEEEAKRFRDIYLTTVERSKNVEFIKVFREYLETRGKEAGLRPDSASFRPKLTPTARHFSGLKGLFLTRPTFAFGSLLALALSGLALIYILYSRDNLQTSLQDQYAVLNKQDLSDIQGFSNIPILVLFPSDVRSAGSTIKLRETFPSQDVLLRLALTPEINDASVFNVSLRKDGRDLLVLNSIRAYQVYGGTEIRVLVPRNLLQKGTSEIVITSVSSTALTEKYSLTVE